MSLDKWTIQKLETATVVDDYDFLFDPYTEEFYSSVGEMVDEYENWYYPDDKFELPQKVFVAEKIYLKVDPVEVLESALEDLYFDGCSGEDVKIEDEEEFIDFVTKWNEKQAYFVLEPDYSKCYIIPKEDGDRST